MYLAEYIYSAADYFLGFLRIFAGYEICSDRSSNRVMSSASLMWFALPQFLIIAQNDDTAGIVPTPMNYFPG